jgi:hypothetical protein
MLAVRRISLVLAFPLLASLALGLPGRTPPPGLTRPIRKPAPGANKLVVPVNEIQVAGEMLVGYRKGRAKAVVKRCRQLGVTFVDIHRSGSFLLCAKWKPGQIANIVAQLKAHPGVRYLEPNYPVSAFEGPLTVAKNSGGQALRRPVRRRTPNDLHFRFLHGMENIRAPRAWGAVVKSPVIVALVDTGIDPNHEDLRPNLFFQSRAVLPNRGGTLRNAYGYDFAARNADPGRKEGVYPARFANPRDDVGHGSHCAGIIGARGNNRIGVVGVNWSVRIIALRVLGNGGNAAALADAIDYARLNGARVINASLGFVFKNPDGSVKRRLDGTPIYVDGRSLRAVHEAIGRAERAGILFVVAAGNETNDNDRNPAFPASFPNSNVVAVASIQRDGGLSGFSNFGVRRVHLAAPGGTGGTAPAEQNILSTVPGNRYAFLPGTSMAAPHIAGAAALILGHPRYRRARTRDLKSLILSHARRSPQLAGKCLTGGSLDIGFLGSNAQFYDPWKKDPKRRRYYTRYHYKPRRGTRRYHYHHCYSYFSQPGRYYFYSPRPFRYGWYSPKKGRVVWRRYRRGFYGRCVVSEDGLVSYQKLDKAYDGKLRSIPEKKFGPEEPMPLIPEMRPGASEEPLLMEAPLSPPGSGKRRP